MTKDSVSIGRLGAPKGVRGDLKVQSYSGESAHFRKLKEVELRSDASLEKAASAALRLKVLRVEGEANSLTMAFDGYATPEAARALTGMIITVPRSMAAPLGPGQWYADDLIGLALTVAGKKVAVVRSILEGGPESWLEVVHDPERNSGVDLSSSAQETNGAEKPNSSGNLRSSAKDTDGTAKRHASADPSSSARDDNGTAKRNSGGVSLIPLRKEFIGEIDLAGGTIELLFPELLEE